MQSAKAPSKKNGQPISVANDSIPAFAYCICDFTPTLREVMKDIDAFQRLTIKDSIAFIGDTESTTK
jgi:hypothetical protein